LGDLQQSLQAKGLRLEIVPRYCLGRERTELLNRARISLNMVSYPWDFPGARFLLSIGCGALVVSEPLENPGPYRAGEHFVQAEVADLPKIIAYYVAHEAEREALTRSAFRFVTCELTLKSSMAHIMEVCHADSAVSSDPVRGGD
jgi:spore maturation protein CgeB